MVTPTSRRTRADAVRQLFGGHAVIGKRAGEIQIAFVDGRWLHAVGIGQVNFVDLTGNALIQLVLRRHKNQLRTLFLRLPDGIRRLDAPAFGQLVLGHDHALAALRVPGHGHGNKPELGALQTLAGREEVVAIAVENQARRRHMDHLPTGRAKKKRRVEEMAAFLSLL